jgi:hypothetical protein
VPDIPYRVGEAERRLTVIEGKTEEIPVLRNETAHLAEALHELGEEVKALRRAIVTAAISFAASAVILAISVLLAFR